jgi:hypothetical protein
MQKGAIGVDLGGTLKDQQVGEHVGNQVGHPDESGGRHDDLLPNRRLPQ